MVPRSSDADTLWIGYTLRTFLLQGGGVIKRKLRCLSSLSPSPVGALPVRELSAEQLAAVPGLCAVALLGCGEVDRNPGLPPVRA